MATNRTIDALVLGGGPAGATAAALLAGGGLGTVILESERSRCLHVGESLLPHTLPLLDELGVHDAVRDLPHTRRTDGTTFVAHDGSRQAVYWFDRAWPPALPHAWQVHREEFDAVLLANAVRRGAELWQGWRATAPLWEGNRLVGLRAASPDGEEHDLHCRALLDASGRQAFLANRMGWRFPYPRHRKVVAVGHFAGVRLPAGREAGNTTVVVTDGGWFWLIPFRDGAASVGAVLDVAKWRARDGGAEEMFEFARRATPEVARRLADATPLVPFAAVQNFSHRVMHVAGEGYCAIGDAAGFLDPIFSTGVFLATTTAASAARDVREALDRHGRVDAYDFGPTLALTRSLQRVFFSLMRAFHDPDFLPFLFDPPPAFRIAEALTSLLAGDVVRPGRWRRTLRYRALAGLARAQHLGRRLGRPLAVPLAAAPGRPR